jgi:hypothetical protein
VAISIYIEEKIKTRLLPIAFNGKKWCHFAPRSDNAEDRELEGVPNVIELYRNLTKEKIACILYTMS